MGNDSEDKQTNVIEQCNLSQDRWEKKHQAETKIDAERLGWRNKKIIIIIVTRMKDDGDEDLGWR